MPFACTAQAYQGGFKIKQAQIAKVWSETGRDNPGFSRHATLSILEPDSEVSVDQITDLRVFAGTNAFNAVVRVDERYAWFDGPVALREGHDNDLVTDFRESCSPAVEDALPGLFRGDDVCRQAGSGGDVYNLHGLILRHTGGVQVFPAERQGANVLHVLVRQPDAMHFREQVGPQHHAGPP